MPLGDFQEAGTIPRPLPLGRALRLLFGVGCIFLFIWYISEYTALVGSDVPDAGFWVAFGFAFWYLPDMVVVGFSRAWGRWPQAVAAGVALALVAADLVAYGSAWGPPLGWSLFMLTELFYGLLGVSFVLAAVLAVPG